jgi:hypothetical protein
MGLIIVVGELADLLIHSPKEADWARDDFSIINRYLSDHGLPEHKEPDKLPSLKSRAMEMGFPYSFLHYLRRVYAYAKNNPGWNAVHIPEEQELAMDAAANEEMNKFNSHLVCHADCEGYYIPIDFSDLITGDAVPGIVVGSSYRLREELNFVAGPLGITLQDEELSDQEVVRINTMVSEECSLYREYVAWLSLFEATRLSITHKTAIVFR